MIDYKILKSRLIENNLDFVTLILAQFVWIYHLIFNPKKCKMNEKIKKNKKKNFDHWKWLLFYSSKSFTKRDFYKIEFWARYDWFHVSHFKGLLLSKQIVPKNHSGRALSNACGILLRSTGFLVCPRDPKFSMYAWDGSLQPVFRVQSRAPNF